MADELVQTADIDTARLRELLAKATPGPWEDGFYWIVGPKNPTADPLAAFVHDNDGPLIAALRNAAPALLDAAEAGARARDVALEEAANASTDGQIRGLEGHREASLYNQGCVDSARRIRALRRPT